MGLRWTTQRRYIPDLLLTISAFIFGLSVILSALALITAASNINKLRNAIGSWRTGITALARSHRGRATIVDRSRSLASEAASTSLISFSLSVSSSASRKGCYQDGELDSGINVPSSRTV